MQEELSKRGLTFKTHYPIAYWQVDIAFPEYKVAVECDGDYWHRRPERIARDNRLDGYLRSIGWKVLHFWEHEILENVAVCVDRVKEALSRCQS